MVSINDTATLRRLAGEPPTLSLVPQHAPGHLPQAATISALNGRFITGGTVTVTDGGADGWRATLSQLARPGVVASMYFGEGVREVTLQLADGRAARARITGTSFSATAERVCDLAGVEPLCLASAQAPSEASA